MGRLLLAAALLLTPVAAVAAAEKRAAPTFDLKDVNGKRFDLADHLGKEVLVLNFFATWCAPCQAELPMLQRLHEKYAKDGLSVVVVSIDDPKSATKVKPLIREHRYTFPVLLDTETKAVSLYNPKKVIPFSAIIDRRGNLHAQRFGFQPGDEAKLEAELVGLLGGGAAAPGEAAPPEAEATAEPVD